MIKLDEATITRGGFRIKYEEKGRTKFLSVAAPELSEKALQVLMEYCIEKKLVEK